MQSENSRNVLAPLVYEGEIINARAEMLSLTDMWKAAGSPDKQRPTDWKNDSANVAFLDHVAMIQNAAPDGIWKGQRGKGGSTFAHWQIALAYAKYLSPAFHMWCNTVVRERMERGFRGNASFELDEESRAIIGGIVKGVVRAQVSMIVSDALGSILPAMVRAQLASGMSIRDGRTAGEIWREHGLPTIKNGPQWLSGRLKEMGAAMPDDARGECGLTVARKFDHDKANACMRNGLIDRARRYVAERNGQGVLKLVIPAAKKEPPQKPA